MEQTIWPLSNALAQRDGVGVAENVSCSFMEMGLGCQTDYPHTIPPVIIDISAFNYIHCHHQLRSNYFTLATSDMPQPQIATYWRPAFDRNEGETYRQGCL